jgi:hypothetical protein
MPTTLTTPVSTPAVTTVTVLAMNLRWAPGGTLSAITITYIASDSNDNPVSGASALTAYTADGPTMVAAMTAFYTGEVGHPKQGALAALAVLTPAMAGSVT